jgi:hypothetical protein
MALDQLVIGRNMSAIELKINRFETPSRPVMPLTGHRDDRPLESCHRVIWLPLDGFPILNHLQDLDVPDRDRLHRQRRLALWL